MLLAAATVSRLRLRIFRRIDSFLHSCKLKQKVARMTGRPGARRTRPGAVPDQSVVPDRFDRGRRHPALTQTLPNDGFSSAMTLTVLPQALIGTCTGAWTRLPDR